MKNVFFIIIIIIIIAVFFTGCKKCVENYRKLNISIKNTDWIPNINLPIVFESNGKNKIFSEGGTTIEYQKFDDCIEGCCDNYYNRELKIYQIKDPNNDDNFQVVISTNLKSDNSDSLVDLIRISYDKYVWLNNKPRVSSDFVIPVVLDSLDYWCKKNNKYYSSLDINGNRFTDVYSFEANISDSSYNLPTKIFYNKTYGIVGYEMLNGEIWNKK